MGRQNHPSMYACLHGHGWPSPLAAAECDCISDDGEAASLV